MNNIAVAIDGPSGAGKSTIANLLAKQFNLYHLDTGALFRCLALYAYLEKLDINQDKVVDLILSKANVQIKIGHNQEVFYLLNGESVSEAIRQEEVGNLASLLSQNPKMRNYVLDLERRFAEHNNVIMDGRDIGTVVLPQAAVKVYLDARPEERAARRFRELVKRGINCAYTQVLNQINQRDYQDINRPLAPLKQASDAVYIDSSQMDISEVLARISQLIKHAKRDL